MLQSASEPQTATDDPQSRKPRVALVTPSLMRAPRISIHWEAAAKRKYKNLSAAAPIGLPESRALTAAIKAALQQTFSQVAPNALKNPPLHPSLREQIEQRQNATQNYGLEIQVGVFDDDLVRQANREYRDKDKPTDVLSFSPWEGVAFPAPPDEPYIMLGDAIISIETAARQAAELNHDLRAEVAFLAVHGALHLLGYDHGTDSQRRKMFALQDEIVAKVREDKGF